MKQMYHICYGRNTKDGDYVTNQDWINYMETVLDFAFDGYTVQDAGGVWKKEHERAKIVSVCTSHSDKVYDVMETYKKVYDQESVGLFITPAMEFI